MQRGLYQHLDWYLAKMQIERRKTYPTWKKFVGSKKWTQKSGPIMRGVTSAPSPHMRQFFFPQPMSGTPQKDVMDVRELTAEGIVYRHKFEGPIFQFYSEFNDFMDHIDETKEDILEKIDRAEDLFLRGCIYHMSPFAFVAGDKGATLVASNPWLGNAALGVGDGKTAAWFVGNVVPNLGAVGNASLLALNSAVTQMENDLRIPFFSGSDRPVDDAPLSGKYCFVTSSEAYNQFTFDPWMLANKNCSLDIINNSFRGSLFGRITCRLEDLPLRADVDGTFSAPEIRVQGGNPWNLGDTIPNPTYSTITSSPIEVGFLVGDKGFDSIDVGPPPAHFTGNTPPHNFPGMFWNGEVKLTKQFLVPCIDDTGAVTYDMNTYGEYLKFISAVAYGILPRNRKSIIPFFYKRTRGPA